MSLSTPQDTERTNQVVTLSLILMQIMTSVTRGLMKAVRTQTGLFVKGKGKSKTLKFEEDEKELSILQPSPYAQGTGLTIRKRLLLPHKGSNFHAE